jgi:large subunit ribosomal protein L31
MKEGIHPTYRDVVFQDAQANFQFITRSTVQTNRTIKLEGVEYPLFAMEVSSASHPFFTGKHKVMDTAGRIDKFRQKYAKK